MNADEYIAKIKHPRDRKAFDRFDQGRGHCHDCGNYPAFQPRVLVANMETGAVDKYLLQLPHLCNDCVAKRGLTRHGYLVPKTAEFQNFTEATETFLERLPDWVKRAQANSLKDLVDQGMSEEDAKSMLGVK